MSGAFVIRNQLGHYWGKSGSWVTGGRAGQVACWTHRDEAVNTLFELGSQDTDLRGEVMLTETEDELPKNLKIKTLIELNKKLKINLNQFSCLRKII